MPAFADMFRFAAHLHLIQQRHVEAPGTNTNSLGGGEEYTQDTKIQS